MTNSFKVFYKENPSDNYKEFTGLCVFPFTITNLLDERLDETQLVLYTTIKNFKPTTFFKIKLYNQNGETLTTNEYLFILATDQASNYPKGTARYKHILSLIELTKWLEGFFCSSLTFTNSNGNLYTLNATEVLADDVLNAGTIGTFTPLNIPIGKVFTNASLLSPRRAGLSIILPSPREIGEQFIAENFSIPWVPVLNARSDVLIETNITYVVGGVSRTVKTLDDAVTVPDVQEDLKAIYTIAFAYTEGQEFFGTCKLEFDLSVIENQYPMQKWTVTKVVNRILECAEPLFTGQTPRFKFEGIEYIDGQAEAIDGQAKEYENVLIPEITLTKSNLREQLKVIGAFIHAEPRLKEDDTKGFYIVFDKYGNLDEYPIESAGKIVYNSSSQSINDYCTEIRSYAQNIVSSLDKDKGVATEPYNNGFKSIRTQQEFVRITEENGTLITQKPIYEVQSLKCGLLNEDPSVFAIPLVDITPYLFENTRYSILSSFKEEYPYSKAYAINYKLASNTISGLFYKAPHAINPDVYSEFAIVNILSRCSEIPFADIKKAVTANPERLVFEIVYKPITDNFVSHGKQKFTKGVAPFQKLYNQSENLVEATYYGEHIKGVSARLGNIQKEMTIIVYNINSIAKVGQTVKDYAISEVSTQFMPQYIKCTISLTKDFNRISQYVGINSVKHLFEISERQTYQRDILIKEYMIVGDKIPANYNPEKFIFSTLKPFYNMFESKSIPIEKEKVTVAYIENFSKPEKRIAVDCGNPLYQSNGFLAPIVPRAFGNTIVFSFSPKDNYSAGTIAEYEEVNKVTGRWANEARYTDKYGKVYWQSFYLLNNLDNLTAQEKGYLAYRYPMQTLENVECEVRANKGVSGNTGYYRLNKDNREIPNINVELEIKTTRDDIVIGSAMAEMCRLVSDTDNYGYPLVVLLNRNSTYNKFSKTYDPTINNEDVEQITNIVFDDVLKVVKFGEYKTTKDIEGWLLISRNKIKPITVQTEDGEIVEQEVQEGYNIYLASTKKYKNGANIFDGINFYMEK